LGQPTIREICVAQETFLWVEEFEDSISVTCL
jgi:hypothetical protein